jgi:hypothetical protein
MTKPTFLSVRLAAMHSLLLRLLSRPLSVLKAYSPNQSTCHGPICIIMCVNTSAVRRKGQPRNPRFPINERISASITKKSRWVPHVVER